MRDYFYRIIFYWNSFGSDEGRFSGSSTVFDVVGGVYNEIPSDKEMVRAAIEEDFIDEDKKYIFNDVKSKSDYGIVVLRNAKLFAEPSRNGDKQVFLGVVQVPIQCIDPVDGPKEKITYELLSEAANYQDFGISDVGADIKGDSVLVMSGWEFGPLWKLHGYDEENMEEDAGIKNVGFYDENFRCDGCGAIMPTTYHTFYNNQKIIEESLETLGVQCGCYKDYCLDNVQEFINNPEKAIDKDALAQLVTEGKAVHYSDLCNGWTCGNDDPEKAMNELYEFAGTGGIDLVKETNGTPTEGVLFQINCISPFNVNFSMWIYRE